MCSICLLQGHSADSPVVMSSDDSSIKSAASPLASHSATAVLGKKETVSDYVAHK